MMTAKETLRSIVEASAPDDSEDLEIRKVLSAEFALTISLCPPVVIDGADETADDQMGEPRVCALRTDRRLTEHCECCMLSQVP
jgi:hypothetical protein